MADLIPNNVWTQIQSALLDAVDTFADEPIILHHAGGVVARPFNIGKPSDKFPGTDISLNAVLKFLTDTDGEVIRDEQGIVDLTEGELRIHYSYVQAAGLSDANHNLLINPALDQVSVKGTRRDIVTAKTVGDTNGIPTLVYIKFKNTIRPN